MEMIYMFTIKRKPTSPGEILREEFLKELGISQKKLAVHIGCDIKVINRIVNNRSSVSAEMAVKLASTLNTSVQFWLNAQQAVDIYNAMKKIKSFPQPIAKAS
jgi:addiction module HigA family antidote